MAKGLRATTRKRNKRALRATVFGPAHDARLERLSAKLQEVASKPKPDQDKIMDVDGPEDKPASVEESEDMDIDESGVKKLGNSTSTKKTRPSRIEKKIANRKAKSSIVFAPTGQQKRRMQGKGRKK